ncbi:hypothetical protein FE784_22890 [Paenibacillus hemerocallicola]|uniref:Uncharacterized protein n=1 Tax=Paenibacillus hemerocallicola TaxID=1172614 RepID=A0A5C4T4N0_9BACL|nr:hypothetical protein [Paenibacillus hemerocallicola]TNJ64004.1 hypothetical protein FE784_22890 [Paenibacillus hemerocallicola]
MGVLLPPIGQAIDYAPILSHRVVSTDLPVNRLTAADAVNAEREAERLRTVYETELRKLEHDPMRKQERWYVAASAAYRQMHWNKNVANRYEHQKRIKTLRVEMHMLRLGDIAFASNPFELYVDYGIQIKVQSPAVQTFLIQLARGGTYLPSPKSIEGGTARIAKHQRKAAALDDILVLVFSKLLRRYWPNLTSLYRQAQTSVGI